MRINEAAEKAGIAAKNIRFYESQGLINPGRESGNGYRNYTEEDVQQLRRIRLLRLLDVPLTECRAMLEGRMTLADGMRRHMVTLQARRQDVESALQLCQALQNEPGLDDVDLQTLQDRVAAEQKKGVQFMDIENSDIRRKRRWGALVGAGIFALLMAFTVVIMVWGQSVEPLPWGLFAAMAAIPAACIVATVVVLVQRIKEIRKDEIDAYRNY